jgi:hypothetical protein
MLSIFLMALIRVAEPENLKRFRFRFLPYILPDYGSGSGPDSWSYTYIYIYTYVYVHVYVFVNLSVSAYIIYTRYIL